MNHVSTMIGGVGFKDLARFYKVRRSISVLFNCTHLVPDQYHFVGENVSMLDKFLGPVLQHHSH